MADEESGRKLLKRTLQKVLTQEIMKGEIAPKLALKILSEYDKRMGDEFELRDPNEAAGLAVAAPSEKKAEIVTAEEKPNDNGGTNA